MVENTDIGGELSRCGSLDGTDQQTAGRGRLCGGVRAAVACLVLSGAADAASLLMGEDDGRPNSDSNSPGSSSRGGGGGG